MAEAICSLGFHGNDGPNGMKRDICPVSWRPLGQLQEKYGSDGDQEDDNAIP